MTAEALHALANLHYDRLHRIIREEKNILLVITSNAETHDLVVEAILEDVAAELAVMNDGPPIAPVALYHAWNEVNAARMYDKLKGGIDL